MPTLTFTSTLGDGMVTGFNDTTWAIARSEVSGGSADFLSPSFSPLAQFDTGALTYNLRRCFVPFVISGIPGGQVITAAVLRLFLTSRSGPDNSSLVFVGPTTQLSVNSLVAGDFNKAGSLNGPAEIAARVLFTSLILNAYNSFPITDLSVVPTSGNALIGIRTSHDVDNISPTGVNTMDFSSADNVNPAQRPQLDVTFAPASVPGVGGGVFRRRMHLSRLRRGLFG